MIVSRGRPSPGDYICHFGDSLDWKGLEDL